MDKDFNAFMNLTSVSDRDTLGLKFIPGL